MFVYELFDHKNLDEAKQRLDPKCWKGYRKAGTKMKGGVRVNNCVPANEGREHDEGDREPPNNFAIYINGKKWKVFPGLGYYADDFREQAQHRKLKDWCQKKSQATGKRWEVYVTGEPVTESNLNEKWSNKYKRSINCSHPKGFSQRAHCAGRKKNEGLNEFAPSGGGGDDDYPYLHRLAQQIYLAMPQNLTSDYITDPEDLLNYLEDRPDLIKQLQLLDNHSQVWIADEVANIFYDQNGAGEPEELEEFNNNRANDDDDNGEEDDAMQAKFTVITKGGKTLTGTVKVFPGDTTDVEYHLNGKVYIKSDMENVDDYDDFVENAAGYIQEIIQLKGDGNHFVEEGLAEEKKGLYYYVNKRKKAGTSRDKDHPKAPTAQAWKDAAKTAKK